MKRIHALLEKQLFGICAGIADYMGVKTLQVRLSFIYLSFLTFGSPVLAYNSSFAKLASSLRSPRSSVT